MDLQKIFMIAQTNHGTPYYMRKVNVYNFCITEVMTGIPSFYIWAEYDGGKGSAEIYSCINKWLQQNVFNKQNRPFKLRIIADNCGGQNKNNNLVLALLRLVHLKQFHRVELAFLVPGHLYMPCDRKFGNISKELSNYEKN